MKCIYIWGMLFEYKRMISHKHSIHRLQMYAYNLHLKKKEKKKIILLVEQKFSSWNFRFYLKFKLLKDFTFIHSFIRCMVAQWMSLLKALRNIKNMLKRKKKLRKKKKEIIMSGGGGWKNFCWMTSSHILYTNKYLFKRAMNWIKWGYLMQIP